MKWLLAAFLFLVAVVVATASWLLYTESGLHWVAARAQHASAGKLKLEGLHGALASDMRIELVQFHHEQTRVTVRNARLRLELLAFLGRRAGIRWLSADLVDVVLGPPDDKPLERPDLPFGLRLDSADIARIRVERGAQTYLVEELSLRDVFLREPGAVSATAAFTFRHEEYPARGEIRLDGSIERAEVAFEGSIAQIPAKLSAVVTAFAARPLESIDAQAGPIDLQRLNQEWPQTAFEVKLSAKGSAAQPLSGTLSARNGAPGPLDKQRLPLATLDSRFATDFKTLSLEDLKAGLSPAGSITGKGELAPGRADLEVRVADLDLRAFGSTLRATKLQGPLKIMAGEKQQTLQGTLSEAGMTVSADVLRSGDLVEVRSLRAEAAGGTASGTGKLNLAEPMKFDARLKLAHFDPARFGDYPSGDISGSLDATGTLGKELRIDARWQIDDSTLEGAALASRGAARISRARVTQVVAEARLGGARLTARGDFGRPGDELGWALEAPRIEDFVGGIEGRVDASGRLTGNWDNPQAALSARASGVRLPNGVTVKSATAKGSGSLASHSADLTAQIEGLTLEARVRGGWRQQAGWSGEVQSLRNTGRYPMQLKAPAPLKVAPGRVELGRFEAALADGRLLVRELVWAGERLTSSGEFSGLPAQWLVLAAGLTEQLRSTLLMDGQWNLSSTPRLTGTLSMRRTSGDLTLIEGAPVSLELEKAALEARLTDGRVNLAADIASRYATALVKGEVTPEPKAPGLGITAQSAVAFDARIALAELRVLTQGKLTDAYLDGSISAELRGSGTLGKPSLTGSLNGEAIAFDLPPYGVFLKNGELRAVLEGDTLRVTQFSIQAGEGRFTASGVLPLRFEQGGARLAWRAEKFGLMERPDLKLTVSGSGEARLEEKRIALSGELRADRGYLELEQERLPKLSDDVIIVGQQRASPKERARIPLALELQLDLGDQLEVRGYGLEGKLTGRLQIETTKDGELRAYGRIQTLNATFFAYGNRLQVDPGVAIFDGPLDNPSLQMTAWRRNQQVEVGVQVSGSARNPRVQLVSQPPVSEGERLSWLVLGRAPGDATKADLGLLQAAAGALLARGDQMPLDRRIAKAVGVDEISLRGSGEVADRVVAVGKRLSDRLYISYEQGLGTVASQLVKLDFSLTQRLSVRAETGTSSGLGLFYRFSWD